MTTRNAIALAIHRCSEWVSALLLGRAAYAAVSSEPGDDIRVLLGHDGRPPSPGPTSGGIGRLRPANIRMYTMARRDADGTVTAPHAKRPDHRPVLH